jgi:phosphotransferase system enzyme I (PtsI)
LQILTGKSILDQFAFGPLYFYHRTSFHLEPESKLTPEEETHRFYTAQRRAILQLSTLYDSACVELGTQAASIFSIHTILLEDTSLVEEVLSIIRSHHTTAEYAVQAVEQDFSSAFACMDSPYMQARGADIRDISNRVIRCLLGVQTPDPLAAHSGILVSDELLPSEVLALDRRNLLGLVTRHGSVDSHTAMLLRLLKIPGLAEVDISGNDEEGHTALLDGFSHSLYLDPDPQLMTELGLSSTPEHHSLAAAAW